MHALMLVAGITVIHAALFAMMLIFMSSGKGNVEGLNKAGEWLHNHESAILGSTHIHVHGCLHFPACQYQVKCSVV
jgi:hypothetical protein